MVTRMPPRTRDVDPQQEQHKAAMRHAAHRTDEKVLVIGLNTHPGLGESNALPPTLISLYALTQALMTQGYIVGQPIKLDGVVYGTITSRVVYVLPYCPAPLREELFGLDDEQRKAYRQARLLCSHEMAKQAWTAAHDAWVESHS